jgi:mitochondrial FAD-linked sulfhydryl oxidase
MGDAPQEPVSSTSDATTKKAKLPPGMVIGPDGKPCKVCTSFRNWKPPSVASKASSSSSAASGTVAAAAVAAGGAALAGVSLSAEDASRKDCPADVEQLGRATWTFLHTAAAYYPSNPTPAHQKHMFNLLSALPTLYPCGVCADHLRGEVAKFPPVVNSREALSQWLCERHNEVNERLGKEKFVCSIGKLDERWKDGPGDGRCD